MKWVERGLGLYMRLILVGCRGLILIVTALGVSVGGLGEAC